jgi:hypothetical protein
VGQAVVVWTKKQPSASVPHFDCDVPLAQNVAVPEPQLGSTLHVQAAEPDTPVQLEWVPQVAAVPHTVQVPAPVTQV